MSLSYSYNEKKSPSFNYFNSFFFFKKIINFFRIQKQNNSVSYNNISFSNIANFILKYRHSLVFYFWSIKLIY